MEGFALTGAWVDYEQGLISVIVLEMGGSLDLSLLPQARRAGDPMGPTGTPTEPRDGCHEGGRRPRQRGPVLDRPGASARRGPACSTSPANSLDRPLQGRGNRGGVRRGRLVLRRGAGLLRTGRRTASSATSCRRCALMRKARSARSRSTSPRCDRIIAIGSDAMMAAVARARRGARAPSEAASPRDRLHQLADAMHDEGDLRAVPAAACRSGDGRAHVRVHLLQPGPAARSGRLVPSRSVKQNGAQEKLTAFD